jgi:hypothetical protein
LAGPKNFGAKVGNPKKFTVEIFLAENFQEKIRKILKMMCACRAVAGKSAAPQSR